MNAPHRPVRTVPHLVNGDRLTRDEFERRYFAMPDVRKAELIEGEVYMPSPVNQQFHGRPHIQLAAWAATYMAVTPGTDAGDGSTVRLDMGNEPQPDVLLYVEPAAGGRVVLADGYIEGAPDLVVEVSASTASIDLGRKLTAYRRNQVSEYVIQRVYDDALDWFVLRDGHYDRLTPDPADGLLKSVTFPGLWLDSPALLRRYLAAVLAALQRGIASPEHAAFVSRLRAVASAARPV